MRGKAPAVDGRRQHQGMTAFTDSEHPRATDGTFTTKPVTEPSGGFDALAGTDTSVDPEAAARAAYEQELTARGAVPSWDEEDEAIKSLWRGVAAGQMEVFEAPKRPGTNDPELGPACTETQRRRRGHAFYPPKADRARIPRLGSTEGTALADKTIHAHYFVGGADWYIAEADWKTGDAFGYADLGFDEPAWGGIRLPEMESVAVGPYRQPVERELDWTPKRFGDIRLPER